ncbi:MAG: hypothetical protein K2Q18_13710 [Bdellovibrionales bacterium]|nr:hypothetical protein [Bdellovibrionales bacterium]
MTNLFLLLIALLPTTLLAAEAPHRVYIRPDAVFTTLDGKSSSRTGRGIYAFVKPYNSKANYYIVYDKSGKAAYSVNGEAVVEIEKDIQLLPNISAETVYPPPSKLAAIDKDAFFDTQLNIHFDSLQFSNIYSSTSNSSTLGTRFEMRTLYSSTLPVNFGLSLNYELSSWKTNLQYDDEDLPLTMNLHILSVGPHLQHYLYDQDGFAISLVGGIEFAPIYELTSSLGKDKYSGTLLDFGMEFLWGSDHGKWSLGSHYRRHDISLNSTSKMGPKSAPQDIALNSFGLMVGYKYEWDL